MSLNVYGDFTYCLDRKLVIYVYMVCLLSWICFKYFQKLFLRVTRSSGDPTVNLKAVCLSAGNLQRHP